MEPTIEAAEDWQDYVEMFADATEADNEPTVIPIFAAAGFTKGNVLTVSGQAARALAGVGTAEDIQKARQFILDERAKLRH